MPTPEIILQQVQKITGDLVQIGLCDRQNFPCLREIGQGIREVSISSARDISRALKNIPYIEIYSEMCSTQNYNLKMLDGALVLLMYRFFDNKIAAHRLTFFPSPFLEEFQNNPDIYWQDVVYAEVIMKNIVPFPLRFDFDCSERGTQQAEHPRSHLTLGQYQNCRIPVSAPLTPYHFVGFLLRNFYNTAYRRYCDELSVFKHCFDESITSQERNLLYLQTPF